MPMVEEVCTITAKGQTTVPRAVRQALGLGYGGRIAFRVDGDTVTVRALAQDDPALAPFLALLEADLAKRPTAVVPLAPKRVARLTTLTEGLTEIDPDAPIEGPVTL